MNHHPPPSRRGPPYDGQGMPQQWPQLSQGSCQSMHGDPRHHSYSHQPMHQPPPPPPMTMNCGGGDYGQSNNSGFNNNYSQPVPDQIHSHGGGGGPNFTPHRNNDNNPMRNGNNNNNQGQGGNSRKRAAKRRAKHDLPGPAGAWFRQQKQKKKARKKDESQKNGGLKVAAAVQSNDDATTVSSSGLNENQPFSQTTENSLSQNNTESTKPDETTTSSQPSDEKKREQERFFQDYSSELHECNAWNLMCASLNRVMPAMWQMNDNNASIASYKRLLRNRIPKKYALIHEIHEGLYDTNHLGTPMLYKGDLRLPLLVGYVASVQCHAHSDWTALLVDEMHSAVANTKNGYGHGSKGSSSYVGRGILCWIEERLVKQHSNWVRPGAVWMLEGAKLALYASRGDEDEEEDSEDEENESGYSNLAAVITGTDISPSTDTARGGGNIDRMILVGESCIANAWTPEEAASSFTHNEYLNLTEERANVFNPDEGTVNVRDGSDKVSDVALAEKKAVDMYLPSGLEDNMATKKCGSDGKNLSTVSPMPPPLSKPSDSMLVGSDAALNALGSDGVLEMLPESGSNTTGPDGQSKVTENKTIQTNTSTAPCGEDIIEKSSPILSGATMQTHVKVNEKDSSQKMSGNEGSIAGEPILEIVFTTATICDQVGCSVGHNSQNSKGTENSLGSTNPYAKTKKTPVNARAYLSTASAPKSSSIGSAPDSSKKSPSNSKQNGSQSKRQLHVEDTNNNDLLGLLQSKADEPLRKTNPQSAGQSQELASKSLSKVTVSPPNPYAEKNASKHECAPVLSAQKATNLEVPGTTANVVTSQNKKRVKAKSSNTNPFGSFAAKPITQARKPNAGEITTSQENNAEARIVSESPNSSPEEQKISESINVELLNKSKTDNSPQHLQRNDSFDDMLDEEEDLSELVAATNKSSQSTPKEQSTQKQQEGNTDLGIQNVQKSACDPTDPKIDEDRGLSDAATAAKTEYLTPKDQTTQHVQQPRIDTGDSFDDMLDEDEDTATIMEQNPSDKSALPDSFAQSSLTAKPNCTQQLPPVATHAQKIPSAQTTAPVASLFDSLDGDDMDYLSEDD